MNRTVMVSLVVVSFSLVIWLGLKLNDARKWQVALDLCIATSANEGTLRDCIAKLP